MDSWNKFSQLLLENNHIKISIEKRIFLSLVDDDSNFIRKDKFFYEINKLGILYNDPRLDHLKDNFNSLPELINFDDFKLSIQNHICILSKIFKKELIIPDFQIFCDKIDSIYDSTLPFNDGDVASYIPQLKRVNPNQYGISICTIDGQRYNIGDSNIDFTVQSCCKPINYGIALEELGEDKVHTYVGREPSGHSFNELTLNNEGKPHNPLINSGAIMTSSLIQNDKNPSERFENVMNIWSKLSGGIYKIGFNNSVYLSEKNTADRNYALAYFMQETNDEKKIGFPENTKLNETMELYFQCCSIEVNTQIMSIVASTLANGGVNPFTNEKIWSPSTVKNILSMMMLCGMYDYSGEYAFKIGIPSKSGVAGCIMLVIPNVMGIAIWSPRLDSIGNSARGIEFCKEFGKVFNFHMFDNLSDDTKYNPTIDSYSSHQLNEFSELCLSAQKGDIDHLKKLFNLEIDMNQSDYDGRTALHLAVCENHIEIVQFLLNIAKVNKNPKDRWNKTPLDEAIKLNHTEIIDLLQ